MTGPEIENRKHPWRNFYGRRHGKTLRKHQKELLETRLAEMAPRGVTRAENPERRPIDPKVLFPEAREIWLEIGFGGGEHMLHLAAAHPEAGIIGCEAFVNGVAMLLSGIERAGVGNIAIHAGDARDLIEVLPEASVSRVYLLYPDPWPKKRHHKRRFVDAANLSELARIIAPGGLFRIATDIEDYVRHSLEAISADGRFTHERGQSADWSTPWAEWPGTRYEAKALREGRFPHYLSFTRV
jgi:tRNA (guanine-N7-)-methyltransferase